VAKSFKLKNNVYLASNSIMHGHTLLSEKIYDSGWKEATLTSSFSHLSWNKLYYRKANGIVTVCGTVDFNSVPSWGTTITTLPEGYRPRNEIDIYCRLSNNNYPCLIAITTGGAINWLNAILGNTPNASNGIWIFATFIAA